VRFSSDPQWPGDQREPFRPLSEIGLVLRLGVAGSDRQVEVVAGLKRASSATPLRDGRQDLGTWQVPGETSVSNDE
jgi:hypothetical protein